MNGDRLAEAEKVEGKSLRTVDGVGQNGGMRCKVGQRVDCVRSSQAPTSCYENQVVTSSAFTNQRTKNNKNPKLKTQSKLNIFIK
jgi:hypothetical protein